MVLTKETAIIYLFVAGVFYLSVSIKDRHEEAFKLKNLLLIAAPGIVWSLFLLLHYASYGVFFYQDHLSYIDFSPEAFQKRLGGAVTTAIVHSGRVLMLIGFLLSYSIQKFFFKQKLNIEKTFLLIWISMLCFLIFLSFNFYTPRYALNLIILLCIVFAIAFSQLTIPNGLKHAITVAFALVCLFFSVNTKRNIDIDLGYVEVIKVNQKMVYYLEQSDLYDQPIAASFNLYHAMTNSGMGYLENHRTFTNVKQLNDYKNAKYFAFETTSGKHPAIEYAKANYKLVKAFSDKHAWGFIYENPSPELPDNK